MVDFVRISNRQVGIRMTEELWFLLIIWFICCYLGLKYKQRFFTSLSGLLGVFLGFLCFTNLYAWLGLIFLIIGVYLFYYSLFKLVAK